LNAKGDSDLKRSELFHALDAELRQIISTSGIPAVSLVFEVVGASKSLSIDGDRRFHAASTMKVAVMMEFYRRIAQGQIQPDGEIEIYNQFRSVVDGAKFRTTRSYDSDPTFYDLIGKVVSLQSLVERMICKSSNLATNILVDVIGIDPVNRLMDELGCSDMMIARGVQDDNAYRAGIVNRATPAAFCRLFATLANSPLFSQEHREQMLAILTRQENRAGIPSRITNCKRVCNKTGNLKELFHDGALIEDLEGNRFALAVFTEGVSWRRAASVVARLAEACWVHRNEGFLE
jgi:beta-lactamase class A